MSLQRIGVGLPKDVFDRLLEKARAERRSVAQTAQRLLEDALEARAGSRAVTTQEIRDAIAERRQVRVQEHPHPTEPGELKYEPIR